MKLIFFFLLPIAAFGQWYATPKVGLVYPSSCTIETGSYPATLNFKHGQTYGISSGYDFQWSKLELAYDYTSVQTTNYTILGFKKDYTDTIEEHALFVNAIATPFYFRGLVPYAGLGGGYIRNSVNLTGWQWMAGIEYELNSRTSLNFGYLKRFTSDMNEGGWTIKNPTASIYTVGFTFKF